MDPMKHNSIEIKKEKKKGLKNSKVVTFTNSYSVRNLDSMNRFLEAFKITKRSMNRDKLKGEKIGKFKSYVKAAVTFTEYNLRETST